MYKAKKIIIHIHKLNKTNLYNSREIQHIISFSFLGNVQFYCFGDCYTFFCSSLALDYNIFWFSSGDGGLPLALLRWYD